MNGIEVKVRAPCQRCQGTGKVMSAVEAARQATAHNRAARQCNMQPNYLTAADFERCDECKGKGKKESWVALSELLSK